MRPLPHICFHFPFHKERRAELEMDDDEVATRSAIQFKISNLFPQFQQIPMKFWRQLTHFERNVTLATAISTLSRYKWKEWEKLHIVSLWMNESRQWHRRPGARLVERWWIVRLLFCRPMIKFPLLGGPWIVIFEENDDTCKWADSKVAIFWKKFSSSSFQNTNLFDSIQLTTIRAIGLFWKEFRKFKLIIKLGTFDSSLSVNLMMFQQLLELLLNFNGKMSLEADDSSAIWPIWCSVGGQLPGKWWPYIRETCNHLADEIIAASY